MVPRVSGGLGRRLFSVANCVQVICDRMVGKCYKLSKLKSVFVVAFIYIEGCLSKFPVVLNHRIKYILLSVLTQKSLFEVVEEKSRRQRIAKLCKNSLHIRVKFIALIWIHRKQYSFNVPDLAGFLKTLLKNRATLVFFSSPTLAQGFCLRKMGGKALSRGCSLLLLFSSLSFFPSPSLMWFSALSSDPKNLPVALSPSTGRQIFLGSFSKVQLLSFLYIRMLFFRAKLNILIFPPILAWDIFVLFLNYNSKRKNLSYPFYALLLFFSFFLLRSFAVGGNNNLISLKIIILSEISASVLFLKYS